MIYVLNTNLNNKKKIYIALNEIQGLGKFQSLQICDQLGISPDLRLKQLTGLQLEQLIQMISQNYEIGLEVKRSRLKNIQRLVKIACYKGFRHTLGLPVHGQRTHGNSKTSRKLKLSLYSDSKK